MVVVRLAVVVFLSPQHASVGVKREDRYKMRPFGFNIWLVWLRRKQIDRGWLEMTFTRVQVVWANFLEIRRPPPPALIRHALGVDIMLIRIYRAIVRAFVRRDCERRSNKPTLRAYTYISGTHRKGVMLYHEAMSSNSP